MLSGCVLLGPFSVSSFFLRLPRDLKPVDFDKSPGKSETLKVPNSPDSRARGFRRFRKDLEDL